MEARTKPTILLVAESVTLAHFGRIASLAKALDPDCYRVRVASDPRYLELDPELRPIYEPISSVAPDRFAHALAHGSPLYDSATLTRYVEEDLALLERIKPDLVVGDFRLSLAVSAPLARVPYAAVVNAYWSPYADIRYPVPDLPMTRLLGVGLAQRLFDLARPLAFALHARPLNRVRRRYGLPALEQDLRTVYSWGDYTLYADLPEMVPSRPLPPRHRYLGPVLWSTDTPLPGWWGQWPQDRPVVLVTLGSSGQADLLPGLLRELARLPVTLLAATAGRVTLGDLPDNVLAADYLPLETATGAARLVICNGGSLTTYQALAQGVPALGLCSNMDQLLNMGAISRLGAGRLLRAARATPAAVRAAAAAMLADPEPARAAGRLARRMQGQALRHAFPQVLEDMLRGLP